MSDLAVFGGRKGVLFGVIECERPDLIVGYADRWWLDSDGRLHIEHHNAYVRSGLRNSLLREFALGGTGVGFIGVDNNTTAVTGDTRFLHGATAGTAVSTTLIKAVSPAATIVTDGAGVTQTVTAGATFANGDFSSGVFVVNKVGLKLSATLPEPDGDLVDVIGGTGGTTPYNRTFSLDLTGAGTFSATLQIAVTAQAT